MPHWAAMTDEHHFLLLGDPVEHSRSPQIHRAALQELGVAGSYVARRSDESGLLSAIESLRSGTITGINVTMPLKGLAAAACDELTEEAASSSSVNTLRSRRRGVEGHSTDLVAVRSILNRDEFARKAPLLVLGAGGAAAAVTAAAKERVIYVSARDRNRALGLANSVPSAAVCSWGTPVAGAILINATPLGMKGEALPEGVVEVSAGLIDLAYGERATPAIQRAMELGLPVADGIEFLVTQAAASLEWWLDVTAPVETMLISARKH